MNKVYCVFCGKELRDGVICPHPKVNPGKKGVICYSHCKGCKFFEGTMSNTMCLYLWSKEHGAKRA